MQSNQAVGNWAKQNIPQPVQITPFSGNKNAAKIAFYFLVLFFGLIGSMIVYGYIISFQKGEEQNVIMLFFGLMMIALPFALSKFLNFAKNKIISSIDANGIQTQGGRFYSWDSLKKIHFHKAMNKTDMNQVDTYIIAFKFEKGNATIGYLFRDFGFVLNLANQVPVPKTESINAYSR